MIALTVTSKQPPPPAARTDLFSCSPRPLSIAPTRLCSKSVHDLKQQSVKWHATKKTRQIWHLNTAEVPIQTKKRTCRTLSEYCPFRPRQPMRMVRECYSVHELIELRKLRQVRQGIDAAKLSAGDEKRRFVPSHVPSCISAYNSFHTTPHESHRPFAKSMI